MIDGLRRGVPLLRGNERLLMILVSTMLVMSGQGIIAPVLPLFATEFGAGAASVGLTLSIFALARLLLNVPLGVLSDRYGRRLLLVGGPLVNAIGMVGSGLSPGIGELLAWRFVAGAGSAMYMTGAQIYLADISIPGTRARVIGANHAALLVGVSIGPGIGGLLAGSYGFRVPFYAVGFGALVAAVWAYLRLPETGTHASHGAGSGAVAATSRRPWLELMRSRDFIAVSSITAAVFLTRAGGRMTLMPLLAASELGYSVASIGGLFTVMAMINLVGVAPAAVIADRFGRKWAIVPSGLIIGVALVLMASVQTQAAFLISALLLAVGTSIIGPAPAAYAADLAPMALRGLAMGLYRSAGDLGFTLGPVLLGLLADSTSIGWALVANAAVVVLASAFFGLGARETLPQIDPVPIREDRADLEVRAPRS